MNVDTTFGIVGIRFFVFCVPISLLSMSPRPGRFAPSKIELINAAPITDFSFEASQSDPGGSIFPQGN